MYGYTSTDQVFEVESIVGVFDFKINRWYLVIWAGHDESEWERDNETTCLRKPKLLDILKINSVSTTSTTAPAPNKLTSPQTRDITPNTTDTEWATVAPRPPVTPTSTTYI